jgi:hypothetical protein
VHPNLHYLGSADDSANSLAQNRKQFHRRMAQLGLTQHEQGVTAHGLRHEYVHARMQANGALAPIKLLKRGQFTGRMLELIGRPISFTDGSTMDDTDDSPERKAADPSQDLTARRNLVEQLGHSRTSITTMYSGSHSHLDQMRAATALGTCHILEGNATFIDEHANNAHVDVLWLAGDRAKGLFEFTDRTAPLVLIARIKEVIKNGVRQNPIISLQSFGREIGERFGMSVVVMLENDERVKAVGPGIELQLPTKPRTPAVRTTPNVAVPPGGFNVQDLMRPDEDEDH